MGFQNDAIWGFYWVPVMWELPKIGDPNILP